MFSVARRWLRIAVTVVFSAALLLAILDYGATGYETRSVLSIGVFAALVFSAATVGVPEHARGLVILASLVLLAVMAVVFVQTEPLPWLVSPHPAWAAAAPFDGGAAARVASLTPADDRFALLSVALPFGFFILALILFDTDERAGRAMEWIALGGGAISVWSVFQFVLFPDTLAFAEKRHYLDSLTGFFVNRNTAATFFGLILLLLSAVLWRRVQALDLRRIRAVVAGGYRLEREDSRGLLAAAVTAVLLAACFIALMLTQSRGGVASSLAGLLVFLALNYAGQRRRRRSRFGASASSWSLGRVLTLVGATALVAAAFAVFAGRTLLRAQIHGTEDGRFCIMPGVLTAIRDNLPIGTGLASFPDAYAPYHRPDCSITAIYMRAHNVYLEGMLTLGVAFPVLVAVAVGSLLFVFMRGVVRRRSYRFAANLGIAGVILVALHSAIDFSLQIPGFAIAFAVFLAPAATICLRQPRTPASDGNRRGGHRHYRGHYRGDADLTSSPEA